MKSFKQFNEAKEKEVFFTFGRFNPPTTGHQKLMDKIAKVAKSKDYKIYASTSNDPKKNPLVYKDKIRFMRKMFPKHARSIVMNNKVNNALAIASDLYDMGYNKITMVVGGDRVQDFDSLLKKYNDTKARHGYYNFVNGINVVSAGERDPDAEGVTGMSASKMRTAASDGDFKLFQNGLPKGYSGAAELFNALRKAMGLKKVNDFREHVQLDKVSDIRELYARGEVFNVGDTVYNKENKIVTISERKPNYIVSSIGKKYWIQDLSEVKQDPDVKDKKGTQPAKYYGKDAKGKEMSKSTKDKRDAHFKKGAAKDDDDDSAYEPAPGDATAKTKPSKHTKKYQQMFGEKTKYMTMVQLKKELKKEYGSKASSLKIVKIKGGVSIQTPSGQELERYNNVPKLGYTMVEDVQLDEKLITFAKKAYPKSGHALILAGGAGSGKGFVLDNLIGMEGKKFDVDELKRLVLKAPKIAQIVKDKTGQELSKFDLTRSGDVSKLHSIVADELNLPNKKMAAFFTSVMTKQPEDKPNVIFDVTLKDLRKLDNITRLLQGASYPTKNIHIVWVVNDVEVAKSQNTDPTRGRVVPIEILVNTHRGASQTMLDIVKMGKGLKKYMDGDITFAFNKIGVDSDLKKSDKGGQFLKDALYFKVKESGKPPMKHTDIEKDILRKIQKYVPKGQEWVVESTKSFKETYGELGTDKLTKKYKKNTPGEEVDEADGCWDGYKQVGMKKKGNKNVPNCVPEEKDLEEKKSETWENGFERRVVRTTKPEHKAKGYEWRIKGKERAEISIKLYKTKPNFAEFKKQMKRVAGHEFGG